jgi:hypothetical protein
MEFHYPLDYISKTALCLESGGNKNPRIRHFIICYLQRPFKYRYCRLYASKNPRIRHFIIRYLQRPHKYRFCRLYARRAMGNKSKGMPRLTMPDERQELRGI